MSSRLFKKKKQSRDRRPSIMDISTNEPGLATYGTIGPSFRRYADSAFVENGRAGKQYKDKKDKHPRHRNDSMNGDTTSLASGGSDVTGADSGITEDYIPPQPELFRGKWNREESLASLKKEQKKRKKNKDGMKPRDKERLARNRGMIVRTLDVGMVMPDMRKAGVIDSKDEDYIMDDPRRRQRAARFLDVLECKKSQAFDTFLEVMADHYPQVYLQLVDWEDDDTGHFSAKGEDEWSTMRKIRRLLIDDLDAGKVVPYLKEKSVLTDREVKEISRISSSSKRNEALLDILETKSSNAYEFFLESVGENFPHLYLLLTERADEDDDYDALYG